MTSLVSNPVSPMKDGTPSLPRRQSSLARPPLRALYDLLIAPMEGVSGSRDGVPPWPPVSLSHTQVAVETQRSCIFFPVSPSALDTCS
jgi:hypothetical protein